MKINLISLIVLIIIYHSSCIKQKNPRVNKTSLDTIKKNLEEQQANLLTTTKNQSNTSTLKITNVVKPKRPVIPKKKPILKLLPLELVREWAGEISEKLFENEKQVVRRKELEEAFSKIRIRHRNGTAIVEKMVSALEDLLVRRGKAAEAIMRKAEELATAATEVPAGYTYHRSIDLNVLKKYEEPESRWEMPLNCRGLDKVKLRSSQHFDAQISVHTTSAVIAAEVFDCEPKVVHSLYWSENLFYTFKKNYEEDASTEFQYFCSANGFLRHYPAALWSDMYKLKIEVDDIYDCRLRPWYVSASGAPRDVLILLDASGSMVNSSNQYNAEQFTLAMLSALTDDDQVNVLRFNVIVESPISCFNDRLVPANHVNSAAMMAALSLYEVTNITKMDMVLESAVKLLNKQRWAKNRPTSCQQAIVLLTDSLYANFTELMQKLDPEGRIRLFVVWLHDPYGLRDHTRTYGEWVSCARDGHFAELLSPNDVTEQVMRILRNMERPLVGQRENRLRVFSDIYAHVEDPRRSEYNWRVKENEEQAYRYKQLRISKERLLNKTQQYKDYMHQYSLDKYGHYYEGQDINYRLQISVSVPVFDSTTSENITKKLDEEKQRNSTRTYPVNRLLGVAGVDIPLDHLKLILPYHQVGPSGSLILVDHRGNIVLHENIKPVFDGNILKPGYRTVDFLDLEQPAAVHIPRNYSKDWLEFRKDLIITKPQGSRTLHAKNIFEDGIRMTLEQREYHWKRVLNHYTAVVALPKYNKLHASPDTKWTQQLAEEAYKTLAHTDFAVHPDWLYCRHIEPYFDTRENEVVHFVRRRSEEPNFRMKKLEHTLSPIVPAILDKTYQCDGELMAKLCAEAIATDKWAREHEMPGTDRDCSTCELGSTTAFFATESGLTRWQQYHATIHHAEPPNGSVWSRGPNELWYKQAAANPGMLIVHAPVTPVRKLRVSYTRPPPLGTRWQWLTAARTLGSTERGIYGVAGYHFHPEHLEDLLDAKTNFPCTEDDEEKCEPRCDGIYWSCVLIDEGGWIVAGGTREEDEESEEEPVREHLATLYPAAMAALLNASVFELNWIHDYQGVCFPPEEEKIKSSAAGLSSLLRSLWRSASIVYHVTRDLVTILAIIQSGNLVGADTQIEKEKRRRRVRRDFEREKYERLYDDRVLVNRTRIAACDRSRPVYILQRTKAMEAFNRSAHLCRWPLVGALVPNTNLVLLALSNHCQNQGRPVPDPLINEPMEISAEWGGSSAASRLACWRNREPLPARPPHTTCYPHNYAQEEGYRQCGPWLPDPEKEEENASSTLNVSKKLLCLMLLIYLSNL